MTKFKAWAQLALQDNFLLMTTLIYMQIPVVLFLIGWLKWYFALGSLGLLIYSNWKIITEYQRNTGLGSLLSIGILIQSLFFYHPYSNQIESGYSALLKCRVDQSLEYRYAKSQLVFDVRYDD